MPLVACSTLPSFARLRKEGMEVLTPHQASARGLREIHIGLLNMMPDAALEATERQFLRLVGASHHAGFYVHPFSFRQIPRSEPAQQHIDTCYSRIEELMEQGLDALILSGANPVQSELTAEPFWQPLTELVDWANQNVCSTLCSCLATHAIVWQLWGIQRYPLAQKRWGVYANRLNPIAHPLIANIDNRFDAPHSHVYEVNAAQFTAAGLVVLAQSPVSDLHLAVSADGLRFVFFQGHPEYDDISLLKEYKREVVRYINGIRADYPPLPENYLSGEGLQIATDFRAKALAHTTDSPALPPFPEQDLARYVDVTWSDTGKAMFNNWLQLVCQVAHPDRKKVLQDGLDPQDPLGLVRDGIL